MVLRGKEIDNKRIKIIIGVLVVVALFGIFLISDFAPLYISGTFGSTALSMDKVELKSSYSRLDGEVWALTFVAEGLGQSYYGSFDADDISDDDDIAKNDFEIFTEYDAQTCNYDINKVPYTPIYNDLKIVTWTCFGNPSSSKSLEKWEDEEGSGYLIMDGYGRSGIITCIAIGGNTKASIGVLESPDIEAEWTTTIDVDGEGKDSITLNNLGSTKGELGDYAYVSWLGNLDTGVSCPDKDEYITYYSNGKWKIGSNYYYREYKDAYNTLLTTSASDTKVIEALVEDINDASSKIDINFGEIKNINSLNTAVVKLELDSALQFPMTTLYIEADTLGIYTPVSEIEINSVDSDCFDSGDDGYITVELENVGDENWNGDVYAKCDGNFDTTSSKSLSIKPGKSRTVKLDLSGSTQTSKEKDNCVVYAEGIVETTSKKVSVCVEGLEYCKAGQKTCEDGDVYKCNLAGTASSIYDKCSDTETCEGAVCVEKDDDDDDDDDGISFLSKIIDFLKNLLSGVFTSFYIIKLILVLGGSLVALLFSKGALDDLNAFADSQKAQWITASVFGLLMFALLFVFIGSLFFWTLVIISGLLLSFSSKIKGVFGR